MPAYDWGQATNVVSLNHRFDPPLGTISEATLLALLSDGKHFSDLYIGMAVYAVITKMKGWRKLNGCLLTLPLNEDLKLRSNPFVVQFGQPFVLPDGGLWDYKGYVFRGSNTTATVSPMSLEEIKEHAGYKAWIGAVFNAVASNGVDDTGGDGGADKAKKAPVVFEYAGKGLVTPIANFNNVVAYHGKHLGQSCTDGLCQPPQAHDAVNTAFQANNRPTYKAKSFWIQTEYHKSKAKSAERPSPTPSDAPAPEAASGSKGKNKGKGKGKKREASSLPPSPLPAEKSNKKAKSVERDVNRLKGK